MRPGNTEIRLAMIGVTAALLSCYPITSRTSRAQEVATRAPKPAERSSGTITGRLISRSGEPLAGALAYAAALGSTGPPQSAPVDTAGSFKFDGLDAGVYRVWASIPGYVPEPPPAGSDSPLYYHLGDSITLTMLKGGVITGTVTSATNGPVVAVSVRVFRVRDQEGKSLQAIVQYNERLTDDRGVYRIYGLPAGSYIVAAGGPSRSFGGMAPSNYNEDTPTYSPSSTRDTASEMSLRNGDEITADIQYRGEPGHAISGTLTGLAPAQGQVFIGGSVTLIDVRNRSSVMSASASSYNNFVFALYGIPDGEYELFGSQLLPSRDSLTSAARRVKVQGSDITGINLTLAPMAAIEGRLVLESDPKAGCAKRRATALQETVIAVRRYEPEAKPATSTASKAAQISDVPILFANFTAEGVPDEKGTFTLKNLRTGWYRIDPRAPASGWYVRSITMGPVQANSTARNSTSNVARDGVILKSGERVSGLTVAITEGAASIRGRLMPAEGEHLPAAGGLRVYLVPVERESADNVLRFFDAPADYDGTFAVGNIAPGRYWLVARALDATEATPLKPIRQDSSLRLRILREAEAAKNEVSLQPCQKMADYQLRYPPTTAPPKQ